MALTNSQYDAIMRIYEQKHLRTHDRLTRHYSEIYEKIPRIREIDEEISHLGVAGAKALIDGNADAPARFRERLHALRDEKQALLAGSGYPSDYLEPSYECPDCQDTGYLDGRKCRCFQKAEIDLLYTQSNLQDILESENFSSFRMDYYSSDFIDPVSGKSSLDMAKEALHVCRSFVDSFGSKFQNLLIYGNTGVGKTFLTHCIARELMDHIHSVIYVTSSGTELTNSFTVSQLFICLNDRILQKKSTIISTNLSLNEIKSIYSERTFSRISSNYRLLKLAGDDIRIKKKLMK